jgi:hypothetical protein
MDFQMCHALCRIGYRLLQRSLDLEYKKEHQFGDWYRGWGGGGEGEVRGWGESWGGGGGYI